MTLSGVCPEDGVRSQGGYQFGMILSSKFSFPQLKD